MASRQGNASASYSGTDSASGEQLSKVQEARVNALYPEIMKQWLALQNQAQTPFAQTLSEVGGQRADMGTAPNYPGITVGGVWNDDQIQQRVNAMRGANDAATGGEVRRLGEGAAGRGFTASSPLYQALTSNAQAKNLATNTQGENDLRWNAAEGNAGQLLRSQQADVARTGVMSDDDFRRRMAAAEDDTRRRSMALNYTAIGKQDNAATGNAMLAALGFYNRPTQYSKSTSRSGSASSGFGYSD